MDTEEHLSWPPPLFFGSRFVYLPRDPRVDSRTTFLGLLILLLVVVVVASLLLVDCNGGGWLFSESIGALCLLVAKAEEPFLVAVVSVVVDAPAPPFLAPPPIMGDETEEKCGDELGSEWEGTLMCAMPSFFFSDSLTLCRWLWGDLAGPGDTVLGVVRPLPPLLPLPLG